MFLPPRSYNIERDTVDLREPLTTVYSTYLPIYLPIYLLFLETYLSFVKERHCGNLRKTRRGGWRALLDDFTG